VSWTLFVLLGLLTVDTLGGPLVIFLTVQGGERPGWPPDRPVEWWTFGVAIVTYLMLFAACLTVGVVRWRRTVAALGPRRKETRGAGR
jgi:hypothetical protein